MGLVGMAILAHTLRAKATQTARMSLGQLRDFARAKGFPDPDTAAAVAYAESGGRYDIIVPEPHGGPSYGLWQIHQSAHPQYEPFSLLNPDYNARAAMAISGGGQDWSAWSTFKNGAYLRYMPGNA